MKIVLLTLSLIIVSPTLFSQSITIGEDGIVRCKDIAIGTTEVIDEVTYEVVDRALLIQRRDEGADLTVNTLPLLSGNLPVVDTPIFTEKVSEVIDSIPITALCAGSVTLG